MRHMHTNAVLQPATPGISPQLLLPLIPDEPWAIPARAVVHAGLPGVSVDDPHAPLVVAAEDIRSNPEDALDKLCVALEIPFTRNMLHWPAGPKPYDGAWASHWYNAVHASTGFGAAEGPLPELKDDFARLVDRAMPHYDKLARYAQ